MARHAQYYMDLPFAGDAEQELKIDGKWDHADHHSSYEFPLTLTVKYESGFSVVDNNDGTFTVESH